MTVNRKFFKTGTLLLGLAVFPLAVGWAHQETASVPVQPVQTVADSDGVGHTAIYQPNNSVTTAQALVVTPVQVTGAVNRPGSGANGWSRTAGDVVDVYQVVLHAGQRITLHLESDGIQDDLDLGLADLQGNVLDVSAGLGRVEALTVRQTGENLVLVGASRGASRYSLRIGPASEEPLPASLRLSDPFVVDQAITRFWDGPLMAADGVRMRAQAAGALEGREQEQRQRNVLLALDSPATARVAASVEPGGFPGGFQPADAHEQAKLVTLYRIKALNRDPDVSRAMPNYLRQVAFTPNDPHYPRQWHYALIQLPQIWPVTTGANVIVAVLDTGVALGHPDLQGQFVPGYDFISSINNSGDGDGIDPNPDDPGDQANRDGTSSFHGTHVAGTVAALTNNGLGVAGVAFNAKIMPLRVLGRDGGTDYDIEQAVRFAAGLANDSGTLPTRRADIINLSLGGPGYLSGSEEIYNQAYNAGAILVAASGNQGRNEPNYPAAFNSVLAVGAVDMNRNLAPYSNYGSWVQVVGPGGNVNQDTNGDNWPDGILSTMAFEQGGGLVYDYSMKQGTSMATPHIAGVLALMKAVAPNLTPQRVQELLTSGVLTDDLGATGKDNQFGYGLINAQKALAAVGGHSSVSGTFQNIDPNRASFGINVGTMTRSP